eukprot:TRINITY_DN34884_c0_g1_i1.p1 TRINITY_DN34884_c0_g1~~TRINITY_DN34884_c0_g1_i1.p1  ORF type:complete len:1156 (-),score=274.93 TRINITY_DN34884_c0_g1_i1:218-3685(-)
MACRTSSRESEVLGAAFEKGCVGPALEEPDSAFQFPVAAPWAAPAAKLTLEVRLCSDWRETLDPKVGRFTKENNIDPEEWDLVVKTSNGQVQDEAKQPAEQDFPLFFEFTRKATAKAQAKGKAKAKSAPVVPVPKAPEPQAPAFSGGLATRAAPLDLPKGTLFRRKGASDSMMSRMSSGTAAEGLYWEPLFVRLRQQELAVWAMPKAGGSSPSSSPVGQASEPAPHERPMEEIPLGELEAVSVNAKDIVLQFKAVKGQGSTDGASAGCFCKRGSSSNAAAQSRALRPPMRFRAGSEAEAERWGKAVRAAEAARLGTMLPAEWNVKNMLKGSSGSVRALQKETISEEMYFILQELLDHTYIAKGTKDRRGNEVPMRLNVTEVIQVRNSTSWVEYTKACNRVGEEAVRRGAQGPLATAPPAVDETSPGVVMLDLTPPVLTTTLDEPLMGPVLGELNSGVNEQWLFHGTTKKSVEGITDAEFRIDLAGTHRGTMYGGGIYLAECSSKADEYAEPDDDGCCRMLLCRVALGHVLVNTQPKPDTDLAEQVTSNACQSLCGDRWTAVGTYREFILYRADQVYPAYIITYRRTMQASLLRSIGDCDVEGAIQVIPYAARLAQSHPSQDVKYRIALLLSTNEEKVVPALLGALQHDARPLVRKTAASALGLLAMYSNRLSARSLSIEKTKPVREVTVGDAAKPFSPDAMGLLPDAKAAQEPPWALAAPDLGECIKNEPDQGVRKAAAKALAQFGKYVLPAVDVLLHCLECEGDAEMRQACADALGGMIGAGDTSQKVVSLLSKRLVDESTEVRTACCSAIGRLGRAGGMAAPMICHRLEDPEASVRAAAAAALGMLAQYAECRPNLLIPVLSDENETARAAAAISLGQMGHRAKSAASQLGELLKEDPVDAVRLAAATALGKIGPPHVSMALANRRRADAASSSYSLSCEVLWTDNWRNTLDHTIGQFTSDHNIDQNDWTLVVLSRDGMQQAPDKEPAPAEFPLRFTFTKKEGEDSPQKGKRSSPKSSDKKGDPDAPPKEMKVAAEALSEALGAGPRAREDRNAAVRVACAKSMGFIGSVAALTVPALIRKGVKDKEESVRMAALDALALLTAQSQLTPNLMTTVELSFRERTKDGSESVRDKAKKALSVMESIRSKHNPFKC